MDDIRPHLLIPETEVDYIEPPPPRGPKKEDVDHFEHGTKDAAVHPPDAAPKARTLCTRRPASILPRPRCNQLSRRNQG